MLSGVDGATVHDAVGTILSRLVVHLNKNNTELYTEDNTRLNTELIT